MKFSRLVSFPALALLSLLVWGNGASQPAQAQAAAFPGLSGPLQATKLPPVSVSPTSPDSYHNTARNNLVIFLRDTQSSWLGLAHGLKSIGVPFSVTTELEQALAHEVVLIYPSLTGANTPPDMQQKLQQFVSAGNSLIAFSVIGDGMKALFGYDEYQERNDLRTLRFNNNELASQFVTDPAESTINLADHNQHAGGISYQELAHPAVASFDDGSGAIIYNTFGTGSDIGYAYAVGFDFSHFTLRAYNGRLTRVVDDYVNAYQPKVDSLLRFIATVYQQGEDDSVEIWSAPYNKEFAALITHDIDYTQSLTNAVAYAQLESQLGVPATYFIQTKYVTDYNDQAFFTNQSRSVIQQLEAAGMAIGSHSVAHSNEFSNMTLGSGRESYPEYQPFVKDFDTVRNASVSGELRVSKYLLESLGADPVVAFRPGHLSLHRKLPEMLDAHGYQYSSSITANEALTHYPYRTTFASEYGSGTSVFEFPVTIEDEQSDLWSRLDQSVDLANKISRHGGLVNLLIHTDETGQKLEFVRRFIAEFKERAWFSTVSEFGQWWRVRDSAVIEVQQITPELKKLSVQVDGTIAGLSLRVPDSWQLEDPVTDVRQVNNVLVIDRLTDSTVISISLH